MPLTTSNAQVRRAVLDDTVRSGRTPRGLKGRGWEIISLDALPRKFGPMPDKDRLATMGSSPPSPTGMNAETSGGRDGMAPYKSVLALLAFIFGLRVAGQLLVLYYEIPFLPVFERRHGATMPYATLLSVQVAIFFTMLIVIFRLAVIGYRPMAGIALKWLGSIYFASMTIRMIIGVSGVSETSWFDGAIPTAFHFVIAAYVTTVGVAIHRPSSQAVPDTLARRAVRIGGYPVVMIGGFTLYVWLLQTGSPFLFSSYLSVLIGATAVFLHESLLPAREDWRPVLDNFIQDGLFLAIVQIALPAVMKVSALALIVGLAAGGAASWQGYWPHGAPIAIQIILMLVIAEFFRYWIHRALHIYRPLWRLHAVHHASDKLYSVNVGRFHPFDKSLQFFGDTVPFLFLGVAPEVFAAYFVFYAINGFYQHSNADIRLGPVNWIVAGPELHRWHHSDVYSEAQSNYGNNLIIWDAAFGTRYLPKEHGVNRVGIGNPLWPEGFLAQMTAPFITSTDSPDR